MIDSSQKMREFESLLRGDQFLVGQGFKFERSDIVRSEGITDRLISIFSNQSRNRVLQYTFSPGSEKRGPYAMLDLFNQAKEELSLEDFLQHNGLLESDKPDPFLLDSYQGDFIEQSRQVIAYIDGVLSAHLMNVVIGRDWMQVPFDWKGYK